MISKCIEEVSYGSTVAAAAASAGAAAAAGTLRGGGGGSSGPEGAAAAALHAASAAGVIADSILTAVYRYLCGYGNGLLSDPLLHRVIYGLMIKLFQKLIGGLRKLGTCVVYADFGRIIIATDKHVSLTSSLISILYIYIFHDFSVAFKFNPFLFSPRLFSFIEP
jgi:hypothetical protein